MGVPGRALIVCVFFLKLCPKRKVVFCTCKICDGHSQFFTLSIKIRIRDISLEGTFHCQGHFTGRDISLKGTFHWKGYFTGRDISLEGIFHWQGHFTGRDISLPGTFHWKGHFTGRETSLPGTFHCQGHFTARHSFLSWGCTYQTNMLSGQVSLLQRFPTSKIPRSGPQEANLKWYSHRGEGLGSYR